MSFWSIEHTRQSSSQNLAVLSQTKELLKELIAFQNRMQRILCMHGVLAPLTNDTAFESDESITRPHWSLEGFQRTQTESPANEMTTTARWRLLYAGSTYCFIMYWGICELVKIVAQWCHSMITLVDWKGSLNIRIEWRELLKEDSFAMCSDNRCREGGIVNNRFLLGLWTCWNYSVCIVILWSQHWTGKIN